jgi:hypothetical protein
MTKQFPSPSSRPLWQLLLAPMLLLSLGLHALFLFMPTASSDEAAIPPPDPETDNIAITRVPPTTDAPSTKTTAAAVPANQIGGARPAGGVPQRDVASSGAQAQPRRQPQSRQNPQPRRTPPSNQQAANSRQNNQNNDESSDRSTRLNSSPAIEIKPLTPAARQQIVAYLKESGPTAAQIQRLQQYIQEKFLYSTADTTLEEYNVNANAWIAAVQEEIGADANFLDQPYQAPADVDPPLVEHYRRLCYEPMPESAILGVLINGDGSIHDRQANDATEADITLLQSTGYTVLDEKAVQQVRELEFPATGEFAAYTVEVPVKVSYGGHDCLEPPAFDAESASDNSAGETSESAPLNAQ